MNISDAHKAVDFIIHQAPIFAEAKANRIYIEEFRKSKKALLMKESGESSAVAQERDAYAHPEYKELLDGLKEAVKVEEQLRWQMVAAQARIEVIRSEESSARAEGRAVR